MLYERWQQIVCDFRREIAVVDFASRRRWTFAELDTLARNVAAQSSFAPGSVLHAQGAGVDFLVQTLVAWRLGTVLGPLEAGTAPPVLPEVPAGVAHLKMTSATTGRARVVMFTAEQLAADAAQIVSTMGLRPDWPNLGCISLAHSYGFSNLVLPLLLHGIPLGLLDTPLPESVRHAIAELGSVTLPAVPALWRAWHEAGVLSPQVHLAISAGAPLPLPLEQLIHQASGLKIHNFYGSTECGGIAYDQSLTPRTDAACIGAPLNQVALAIGPEGCLEVRGPAVGLGYWPEAGATLAGGCFQTSDLAELQEGLVYLRGRAGDLINVAGRKVAPETIEQALRASEAVTECLVFGVPDADLGRGDLIVACVVPRHASVRDEENLRHFLLARLPAWQVPKEWRFVDGLAPNQRGKLSRAQWRTRLGYSAPS